MATPPFSIATATPAAPDLISQYPTAEHLYRDTVFSWLSFISDPTTGRLLGTVMADDVTIPVSLTIGTDLADHFPTGTKMVFHQTAAPTGWTKSTAIDDGALRVVSGSVVNGGSAGFAATFASRTPTGTIGNTTATGTVGDHALTQAEMPAHVHAAGSITAVSAGNHAHTVGASYNGSGTSSTGGYILPTSNGGSTTSTAGAHTHTTTGNSASTGSGDAHTHTLTMNAHNHTFTGTAMDFAVKYADVIIAAKD